MSKLTEENFKKYIELHNELSIEDPYVLKIDDCENLDEALNKLKRENICVYILNSNKNAIGFIEMSNEEKAAFIENAYIKRDCRSVYNYIELLEFADMFCIENRIEDVKFIGVNDNKDLVQALLKCNYAINKEHIQMEKSISQGVKSNISYKRFKEIGDTAYLYNFMKNCMEGSIFNYSEKEVENIINDKEYDSYIFLDNGQAIGFGISCINKLRNEQEKEKIVYIEQIAVDGRYRNHGYGEKIVKFIEGSGIDSEMEKVRLHVYKDNVNAYKLYKKLGFIDVKSILSWSKHF